MVKSNCMFVEMADEMEKAIANVTKVLAEQQALVDDLLLFDKEKYADFINACKTEIENANSQRTMLEQRCKAMRQVVDVIDSDESSLDLAYKLCYAFGIVNDDENELTETTESDDKASKFSIVK